MSEELQKNCSEFSVQKSAPLFSVQRNKRRLVGSVAQGTDFGLRYSRVSDKQRLVLLLKFVNPDGEEDLLIADIDTSKHKNVGQKGN